MRELGSFGQNYGRRMSTKRKKSERFDLHGNLLENFSPVKSPAGASTSGNVVGIPRRIKDSCAEMYNLIQKWNDTVIAGAAVLRKISDTRVQNAEDIQDLSEPEFANLLMSLCNQLEDIFNQLECIVGKLKGVTDSLKALSILDKKYEDNSSPSSIKGRSHVEIVFETWPAEKFYEVVKKLTEMYEKELGVKLSIKEEIALHTDDAVLTFFVTLWTHQVFIEEIGSHLLESMLVECGLH